MAVYLIDLGYGNSNPGGPLQREPALIISLYDLTVRLVTLRYGSIVEQRVEIVPKADSLPLVSLTPDEARGLGYMLRARAREAR
jgi:hypothetical protein